MPYTDIGETWQKLSLISGHARRDPNFQFTSLAHLLNVEYLRDCYKSLNRNKAVGIDNVTWEDYGEDLEENLEKLVSRLKRKKYSAKCREMNEWLKAIRNQTKTKEWWKTLRAKLRGHFQYYGVSENYDGIARFYKFTIRIVRKWLNRRSQKRKMSWDRYVKYLEHYPLPKPKIVHSFYVSPVR